jgi:hypothetical protein
MREGSVPELVVERAARAFAAGAHGVIASPQEAAAIRALPEAAGRLIVTPGVRPLGSAPGDQKRTATPAAAIAAGADHVVVGRPIHGASDPRAAAKPFSPNLLPQTGPSTRPEEANREHSSRDRRIVLTETAILVCFAAIWQSAGISPKS